LNKNGSEKRVEKPFRINNLGRTKSQLKIFRGEKNMIEEFAF
jgi:hypothetical protein